MKKITFTHRTINHSVSGHNNKNSLIASANHDLRIALTESQKLNHDHEMSSQNRFWKDGKRYELTQKNQKILYNMILKPTIIPELSPNPDRDKIQSVIKKSQNLAAAIRTKFKKYKVSDELSVKFQILADPATSIDEIKKIKEQLENEAMSRKETKLKQIDKYIQLRGEIDSTIKPESIRGLDLATCVQTQIYKIPNQHKVTSDQISITKYAEFIQEFHTKHFPNHEVICVIGHVDERSVVEGLEGTGDHCHAYINGRNKSTGKYDLISEQIKVAEKILSEKNPELLNLEKSLLIQDKAELASLRDSNKDSSKFYSRKIEKLNGRYYGRIWQEAMRISANEMLLNKHQLDAEFHYNTRNNKSTLVDQNQPIHKRKFSRAHQKTELLENQKNILINDIKNLKQMKQESITELNNTSEQIRNKNKINSELTNEIELCEHSLQILNKRVNEFSDKAIEFLHNRIDSEPLVIFATEAIEELNQINELASKQFYNTIISASEKIDDTVDTKITTSIRKRSSPKL